jgi:hypothetical protein
LQEPKGSVRGLRARNNLIASMKNGIPSLVWSVAGVAAVFFLAGCESRPERRGQDNGEAATQPAPRPIAMEGMAAFFYGRLAATVSLTRGIVSPPEDRAGGGSGGSSGGGGGRGGGMGGGMGGGHGGGGRGGGMGGGGRGGMGGMGGGSPGDSEGGDAPRRGGGQLGSPLPPVTLRLSLTNTAQDGAPLEVEIVDFESDLGNFALKPDHVALAPGQTSGPGSVISRLGVTSDEIPVKVTLRLAGQKETQSVVLRPKAVPEAPPPKAPAGE